MNERPKVIVIGDEQLAGHLARHIPDADFRSEQIPEDTEGIRADAVVVGGPDPVRTLASVRVHPALDLIPTIVVAPGRGFDEDEWNAAGVRLIASGDVPRRLELTLREVLAPALSVVLRMRSSAQPRIRNHPTESWSETRGIATMKGMDEPTHTGAR